jgi:hypothetical protein
MPLFNGPVLSPLHPEYMTRTSTNRAEDLLPDMAIINKSAWVHFYPDPWHPTRLALVKTEADTNLWYSFIYDIFLDGKLSRWGNEDHNILQYPTQEDVMKLTRFSTDLALMMTYKFIFACLPCLWKTSTQKDYLQILVAAIETSPQLFPKSHRFLYLLFSPGYENTMCIVKETV